MMPTFGGTTGDGRSPSFTSVMTGAQTTRSVERSSSTRPLDWLKVKTFMESELDLLGVHHEPGKASIFLKRICAVALGAVVTGRIATQVQNSALL